MCFDVADGLHVVHDGRLHVEAEHGGEIRRLDARIRALAFEGLEEAGLLTANVGTRAPVDVDVAVEARCRGCFCRGSRLARASLMAFHTMRAASGNSHADVDVAEVGIRREGRDDEALDELMRIVVQDVAILEGAGLGFVAIHHDVVRLAVVVA